MFSLVHDVHGMIISAEGEFGGTEQKSLREIFDPIFSASCLSYSEKPESIETSIERFILKARTDPTTLIGLPRWVLWQRSWDDARKLMKLEGIDITSTLEKKGNRLDSIRRYQLELLLFKKFVAWDTDYPIEYVHDSNGRILEANEEAKKLFAPNPNFIISDEDIRFYFISDLFDRKYRIATQGDREIGFVNVETSTQNLFRVTQYGGLHTFLHVIANRETFKDGSIRIHGIARTADSIMAEVLGRTRRIINGGQVAGWDRNIATGKLFSTASWQDLFRVGPISHLDEIRDKIPSEYHAEIEQNGSFRQQETIHPLKFLHSHVRWTLARGNLDEGEDGIWASGINIDVSEYQRMTELYEAILNTGDAFVFIKDHEKRFLLVNNALASFYGLVSGDSAKNKTDAYFYRGDSRLEIQSQLQSFSASDSAAIYDATRGDNPGMTQPFFERIIPPFGSISDARWFATHKRGVKIGEEYFVIGTAVDVSALALQNEMLEDLFTNAPAVMYCKDLDGRYTKVNGKFVEAVRAHSHFNVIGKKAADFFETTTAEEIEEMDNEVFRTGLSRIHVHEVVFENKERRVYQGAKVRGVYSGLDGRPQVQILGIYFDVTAQADSDKAKVFEAAIASINHDYIQCFLSSILDKVEGESDWVSLKQFRSQWELMLNMCVGFLGRLKYLEFEENDVSRIERNAAPIKRVQYTNSASCLESVLSGIDALCKAASIVNPEHKISDASMAVAKATKVFASEEILTTCLFNFVSNAKKYSRDGADAVLIEVRAGEREKGIKGIFIEVDDAGYGLSVQIQDNPMCVFEKGWRSESFAHIIQGAGNGLYITRILIEHVLGGIVLPPKPSSRGGARFGFFLPQDKVIYAGEYADG